MVVSGLEALGDEAEVVGVDSEIQQRVTEEENREGEAQACGGSRVLGDDAQAAMQLGRG